MPVFCYKRDLRTYVYVLVIKILSAEVFLITVFSQMQDLVFFFKRGAEICDIIINSFMKCRTAVHQTRLLSTRPCRAKPLPALPYCHVRYVHIAQQRVVIPYQHFGTIYLSHLQGSSNPKGQSMTEVK